MRRTADLKENRNLGEKARKFGRRRPEDFLPEGLTISSHMFRIIPFW